MLVGILLSSAKKQVLSYNTTGILLPFSPESKQDPMENLTLLKGVPTDMGPYTATYVNDDSVDTQSKTTYFRVHFEKKGSPEQFDLYPNFKQNTKGQEGVSPNPDKYHYWNKDIFGYVNATNPQNTHDTIQFRPSDPMALHDTTYFSKGFIILDSVVINPDNGKYHFVRTDTALMARVTVVTKDSMRYTAYPLLYVKDNIPRFLNDTVFAQDLALRFDKVVDGKKIELGIKESEQMVPFIAMKVVEFPQIAVLWIGAIIMIIGFVMSILWRRRQSGLSKV